MDFSKFKKDRKEVQAKTAEAIAKQNSNGFQQDERYWQPVIDKAGSGSAVIRFLPAPPNEDIPWVTLFEHGFKRVGGWYIEKSRTTLGQDDPVTEYNNTLWETGDKDKKAMVSGDVNAGISGSKRKKYFISGIEVIKHAARPEDEGKVFLFKYGKKIMDKITEAQNPDTEVDEDAVAIQPFDFWDGANFALTIRKVEGQRNYDKSKFLKPSVLSDDDAELEKLWHTQYSLKAEVAEDKFQSYDVLKKKLERVLGGASQAAQSARSGNDDVDDGQDTGAKLASRRGQASSRKEPQADNPLGDDVEDDEAFFKRLSEEG